MRGKFDKILIIGNGGSGKTTLAALLSQKLQISHVIHLDNYYYRQNDWRPIREEDKVSLLNLALNGDRWIMESTKLDDIMQLIDAAEVIIVLDFPRTFCLWRVFKRGLKQAIFRSGSVHIVKWYDCSAYHWIWRYPDQILPPLLDAIKRKNNVIRLTSRAKVSQFARSI